MDMVFILPFGELFGPPIDFLHANTERAERQTKPSISNLWSNGQLAPAGNFPSKMWESRTKFQGKMCEHRVQLDFCNSG